MTTETWYRHFWTEQFWLLPGSSWMDLVSGDPDVYYPVKTDLVYSLYVSVVLFAVKYMVVYQVGVPLAHSLGIQPVQSKPKAKGIVDDKNSACTNNQRQHTRGQPDHHRAQRYGRTIEKFKGSMWRASMYAALVVYGVYSVWKRDYSLDTRKCWEGIPLQPVTVEVFWYYMFELAFYITELTSHTFLKRRRKDSGIMVTHHVITLVLLGLSWCSNYVRIGTLILLVHDVMDPFLEMAKMAVYCNQKVASNILLVVVAIIFYISRLFVYPFYIVYSMLMESLDVNGYKNHITIAFLGDKPGYKQLPVWHCWTIFAGMLCLLQVFHVIWGYYILLVVKNAFITGRVDDSRSDEED